MELIYEAKMLIGVTSETDVDPDRNDLIESLRAGVTLGLDAEADGTTLRDGSEIASLEIDWESLHQPQRLGTFGDFFQAVCAHLVHDEGWDDPYGTFAPVHDPTGRLLDAMLAAFFGGKLPRTVAHELAMSWSGGEQDDE